MAVRCTALDITIAGFRRLRHDAESHQLTSLGSTCGLGNGALKCSHIRYQVIGWQQQHQRLGILRHQRQRRDCRRRGCIAPDRFEENSLGRDLNRAHLLGHHEAVFVVAYQRGRRDIGDTGKAQHGFLQHGALRHQRQQLLGQRGAGQGPQPGTGTAGKNNGMNMHRTFSRF